MLTVFVEYKVKEVQRDEYVNGINRLKREIARRGGREFYLYEGLDQPNLFVERFTVASEEEYRQIKEWRRLDERFAQHLEGGLEKLHLWAFRQVVPVEREE